MALAMQQALDAFPTNTHVAYHLKLQPWWRLGVEMVAKAYLSDQTWELIIVYQGNYYAVVYDTLTGQCDSIEPLRDE